MLNLKSLTPDFLFSQLIADEEVPERWFVGLCVCACMCV